MPCKTLKISPVIKELLYHPMDENTHPSDVSCTAIKYEVSFICCNGVLTVAYHKQDYLVAGLCLYDTDSV